MEFDLDFEADNRNVRQRLAMLMRSTTLLFRIKDLLPSSLNIGEQHCLDSVRVY